MGNRWLGLVLAGVVAVAGCGDNGHLQDGVVDAAMEIDAGGGDGDGGGTGDGGGGDGASADGGGSDGAAIDAAAVDGAVADGATPDASMADASMADASMADASMADASMADASSDGAVATCAGMPNGSICPGSSDPNMAERCLTNVCVGTYVATPTGAGGVGNNANPGTRAQPKASIGAGITTAQALLGASVAAPVTVFVGISGAINPTNFAENIVVPNNVHISGAWARDAAGAWTRAIGTNVTRVTSNQDLGLLIEDSAITRSSVVVSGLAVQGSNNNADDTCALTVRDDADPTLDQLTVVGGRSGTLSAGICVVRGAAGAQTRPLIQNSTVTGGPGPISAAVRTGNTFLALPEIRGGNLTGGEAGQTSIGFFCMNLCSGTIIENATLTGGDAPDAQGVSITGDTTGIRIMGATIVGGGPAVGGIGAGIRTGLEVSSATGCGGQPLEVSGSTIVAMNRGQTEIARGVHVERCAVNLTSSLIVGVGSSAGPARAGSARGVFCEAATSRCSLTQNSQIAGSSGSNGNTADATISTIAVVLEGVSTLSRTPVVFSGDCNNTAMGNAVGVRVTGSARIDNNVILGGACGGSTGMEFTPAPVISSNAGTEVVNNHIDGRGAAGNGANSRGVMVNGGVGGALAPSGSFVNNTILAGTAMNRTVFEESGLLADPLQVRNNNLFGAATLYRDDNNNLTTTAMVNAMTVGPVATGNISADPMLMGAGNFHLMVTSPNLNAGLASTPMIPAQVFAPRADFDGDARPNPTGAMPDIGPDETN